MINSDIQTMSIELLFIRYLMASYLYYVLNTESPWTDTQYDLACKRLVLEWDTLVSPFKNITDLDSLRSGTGYAIKNYPNVVQTSALIWVQEFKQS